VRPVIARYEAILYLS